MNSFNSSMNFMKLQASINQRPTSNYSESPNYIKSRLQNIGAVYSGHRDPINESSIMLDDI